MQSCSPSDPCPPQVWLTLGLRAVVLLGGMGHLGLDFGLIRERLPFTLGLRLSPSGVVQGVVLTLLVTALSMVAAMAAGDLTAFGWLSRNPVAFAVATFYESFFRRTLPLVQILLIYMALPQYGIILSGLTSGVLALSLNYAETKRFGPASSPYREANGKPLRRSGCRAYRSPALSSAHRRSGSSFPRRARSSFRC